MKYSERGGKEARRGFLSGSAAHRDLLLVEQIPDLCNCHQTKNPHFSPLSHLSSDHMLTPGELLTVGECQESHSLRELAVRHMLERPTGCDVFSHNTSAVINEQLHDGDGGSMQIRQMARGCSE